MRTSFVKIQAFERQNGFSQALLDSFAKQISKMQAVFCLTVAPKYDIIM
jgi:hypothetical protein